IKTTNRNLFKLFLRGRLGRAIDSSDQVLAAVLHKAKLWQRINPKPVNERQRLVINRLLNDFKGYLTTSKYAKLAKCSSDTALRDIRELLSRGILVQNPSGGRSTSYRLAEPDSITADRQMPNDTKGGRESLLLSFKTPDLVGEAQWLACVYPVNALPVMLP
ncbi:MAG: hypothetical protein WCJ35_09795, partial [Planctomycetota bacterium]